MKQIIYICLICLMICSCAGCKKKDQTQQMATVKQESETETVKKTKTDKETEIQTLPQKTTESDSTVTSPENVETEELEVGAEDSWEDSADGWD